METKQHNKNGENKMKNEIKKTRAIKLLTKYGTSENDAIETINKNFDYIMATYPTATPRLIVEISQSLY
jgi:hypothetical protein